MKKVTAILIGAGQRGADVYASYALKYPNEFEITAVAEPRAERRHEFSRQHQIPKERCYKDWEEIMALPKLADCVLICTQDNMHYEVLQKAVERGYDILCEKPITPDKEELLEVRKLAENYEGILSVAHVLRYSPFFTKIKKLLEEGRIGRLMNIQHMECIGFWHMAHSFVRGNWRNCAESSPIILAKCCHDIDILLWLAGSVCERVSSFGDLTLFRRENAPKGATRRCLDGCPARDECAFYAPRFYLEHPKAETDGFRRVVTLEENEGAIIEALQEGPYGRCVYYCDNDVADHQTVNLEFKGGLTANLTMSAFTQRCERVIRIQGSSGEIKGWMEDNRIELVDFVTGHKSCIQLNTPEGGHSGSDISMMKQFVNTVASGNRIHAVDNAVEAVDSHLIALAAEESRKKGGAAITMNKAKEAVYHESGN